MKYWSQSAVFKGDTMNEEHRAVIYQANPLIEGRKPFSAIEMRLFLLALQYINPHLSKNDKFYDEKFEELHLTPAQTKEIFGHGEYLNRLKDICDGMVQKVVTVSYEDGGFKKYPVFGYIEYKSKDGLRIKFNEDMRPLILDIFESGYGYTKIAAKQLFNLSSSYAVRLLELMLQYSGMMKHHIITRHFELRDLRDKMDIGQDEYKRISDFKKRVLNEPIEDINRCTQYKLSYVPIKTGRKITGFDFTMDCSDMVYETRNSAEEIKLEMLPRKTEWHGLSEQAVNKLTTICGSNEEFRKRMNHAVKLAKERKPKNLQGFLYKAVEENYLQQEMDEKEAIVREMKAAQENAEWEQDVSRLFRKEISIDDSKEEIPFNMDDELDLAILKIIRKELSERRLSFTSRSRLEDHNMSVGRFLELYRNA